MSRKRFPDGVFSVTHYLPKKKDTDNAKVVLRQQIPITGQKNVSNTVKKNNRGKKRKKYKCY